MRVIIILFFISSILLSGCWTDDMKCCDYVGTEEIAEGLYVERYRTFCAGVFGELTECYLTDSVTFRQQIGSYDEHESFYAKLNRGTVETYNFEFSLFSDTIERKSISRNQLLQIHHSAQNCLHTIPLFGKNSIQCDNDYYPASSYRTDDGNYFSQIQFKCGNNYSNAVFYTDSLNFSIFIGIYQPGSFENIFKVEQKNKDSFEFYNITDRQKTDTVRFVSFSLKELKKEKLIDVCGQQK